jgi:hypothetical protein
MAPPVEPLQVSKMQAVTPRLTASLFTYNAPPSLDVRMPLNVQSRKVELAVIVRLAV